MPKGLWKNPQALVLSYEETSADGGLYVSVRRFHQKTEVIRIQNALAVANLVSDRALHALDVAFGYGNAFRSSEFAGGSQEGSQVALPVVGQIEY